MVVTFAGEIYEKLPPFPDRSKEIAKGWLVLAELGEIDALEAKAEIKKLWNPLYLPPILDVKDPHSLEVLCSTEMINVKTICELWDFEPKKLAKICTQAWQGNFPNLVLAAGTVAKAVSAFIEFQTDAASLIRGDDRLSGEIGLKRVDTSDVLVGALKKELRGLTDTVAKLNARLMDSIDNCDSDTTVDDIVEKIRYYCDSLTKMVNGLDEDIDAIIVDCTKIAILLGAIHDLFLAARHCDCSQASCVHGSSATDCKHRNMTFPRYSVGRIVGLEMAKESEVGSRVRSRNETVVMFLSADRT